MAEQPVDVLLIGGGVAAVRCARRLRRRKFGGSILLVGDEPHAPYNRPPLSKELLRDEVRTELVLAEPPTWYERHGVGLRTDVAVTRLDAGERLATLADGSRIRYGRCLLATGAAPRRPPIPGAEHAFLLRTLDDALRVRARARDARGGHAVILGGGFIGVEVAASLAAGGMRVTVLELAPALWGGVLGSELSDWALDVLSAAGVTVRVRTAASRLEADGAWVGPERLEADLLLAGVGVLPRDELARDAGLACDDGILTDASHATSASDVFAAGDAARVDGLRVEHWHAAREGGERVALAMLGKALPPPRAPWVFSEFAGQTLDVFGVASPADERHTLGDLAAVAWLRDGVAIQLATINGAIPADAARAAIERGAGLAELQALVPA
ncbi:MAG: NAD(P)/FAD-dependent oxidoreductase [Candidatus Limnocylindria bacterium]